MAAHKIDRKTLRRRVIDYLDNVFGAIAMSDSAEVQPTTVFQRTIHRAAVHSEAAGQTVVTGARVLIAIVAEFESPAASFLTEQGFTPVDAMEQKPATRSERKYLCPECGAIAWGQRDLKLLCGVCHRRMRAEESERR